MDVAAGAVRAVERTVLAYAPTHTLAETCRKVKRDVNREDPGAFARQALARRAGRAVWARATEPGMTRVGADLPAEGAAELMAAIDHLAGEGAAPQDGRTRDQRRADALVQLGRDVLAGGCAHCGLPPRRPPIAVNVTVALSTLLQLDDQHGELNGQPVPAGLARTLALDEDATWWRWLTTPAGRPVDLGSEVYRPSARLRAFLTARHRTCTFPGCGRRAGSCDIDHVTPWPAGATAPWNTMPLCSRHHHLKHEAAGWAVRLFGDGTVEWTAPTGRRTEVPPAQYPADTTADRVRRWTELLTVVVRDDNPVPEDTPPPF